MRVLLIISSLALVASDQVVQVGSPSVVGGAGYGYKFAVPDGLGNVIIATNPVGDHPTLIIKAPIGASGEPSGPDSGQAVLQKSKGHVTCGCIADVLGSKVLYAGLSTPGYVLQVNLSFPVDAVQYLNATDSGLWSNGPSQAVVSAVCQGKYVYLGTKSPSAASTVLRLNTLDSNAASRFLGMGPIVLGDLTQAALWGPTGVLFAMEPDGDVPLSFVMINTAGSLPVVELTTSVPASFTGFESLSGLVADFTRRRVVVANSRGPGLVALIDVSVPSRARIEQLVSLADMGLSPITSFVVDPIAKFVYVTVGDCAGSGDGAFVALRLVPSISKVEEVAAGYDCTAAGVPATSLLAATPSSRIVYVYTQINTASTDFIRHGIVVPYQVFPATPCPSNCKQSEGHGSCAGGRCYCTQAWSGVSCEVARECGGTDCNGHGKCVNNACECELSYAGTFCERFVPCPSNCFDRGTCKNGGCLCDSGYTGVACERVKGDCSALNSCSGHGTCVRDYPAGSCNCDVGYKGDDCSRLDIKCPNSCSGQGTCLEGVCKCNDRWTGLDCSIAVATCPSNCSAHGHCRSGKCTCYQGFKGADCGAVDDAVCTGGCGGHGLCREGSCICDDGWSGANCTTKASDMRVAAHVALAAGEGRAAAAFVSPTVGNEVVVCVTTPAGKCIGLAADTLSRTRDASPAGVAAAALLQVDSAKALLPASLLQIGADAASVSVVVVDSSPAGFAILGLGLSGTGTIHGQLVKISSVNLQRVADLTFDDDTGRGVSAGVAAGDGTFFFASGESPAMIYRIASDLTILSRVSVDQAPLGRVASLLYSKGTLAAATGGTVYLYKVTPQSIDAVAAAPTLNIPPSFGTITSGFADADSDPVQLYLGTDGSPAGVVRITVDSSLGPFISKSLRLRVGENKITTATHHGDTAYFGLAADAASSSCLVVKVSISTLTELDDAALSDCTADLLSSAISADGSSAYFTNGASPAHVYALRLTPRVPCPDDCNQHGVCVQGTCLCNSGWMGEACAVATPVCPNNCSQAGECVNGFCQCALGHFGTDCSTVAVCTEKCAHGRCAGPSNTWPCACDSNAWGGPFCDMAQTFCPNDCSMRGQCIDGACVCDTGYKGADCSVVVYLPVNARGCQRDADCGSHGVCQSAAGTGRCSCAQGWSGIDCDVEDQFKQSVQTSKLNPAIVALMAVGCVVIGMVAGVALYKSWLARAAAPSTNGTSIQANASADGKPPRAASVTRLPRRLVK